MSFGNWQLSNAEISDRSLSVPCRGQGEVFVSSKGELKYYATLKV